MLVESRQHLARGRHPHPQPAIQVDGAGEALRPGAPVDENRRHARGIASIAGADEVGFELGFTPMVKFSCLLFPSVLAYIEGGAGIISESINSPAIAHAFNFTPQAGAGFDIALTPQMALSVAYRFRHSSNAGIYKENPAFNVSFVQAGLTYFY